MSFDLNKNSNDSENKKGFSLDKKDEESIKPLKKDLNLKKTDTTTKVGVDLSKDKVKIESNSGHSENEPKKKLPLLLIAIIAIAVLGIFWFINRRGSDESVVPHVEGAPTVINNTVSPQNEVASDSVQTEQPIATSSSTKETSINSEPANSTNSNTKINNSSVSKNNDSSNSSIQGTIEDKANQVIDGVFGNGVDRKRALGAEYEAIQSKVNEMYRNKK